MVDFGAIRLVDQNEIEMVTAQFGTEDATLEPRLDPAVDDDRIQAFYREVVPLGGGYQVRLVDVASGECLTRMAGQIVLNPCDTALSEQRFNEHIEHLDNRDRYSYISNNEAIDYSQSPLIASPWSGAAEQRFLMWLTLY